MKRTLSLDAATEAMVLPKRSTERTSRRAKSIWTVFMGFRGETFETARKFRNPTPNRAKLAVIDAFRSRPCCGRPWKVVFIPNHDVAEAENLSSRPAIPWAGP